ncbi:uncharacterized protein LOC111392732 [Olea europaea var. sylvestris]|uniref:uncharacterized protein LOC111392732 n=1 Tax=Olea europaea var. sylvestris TaxID=158386 RepID=UPI000C1CD039|nr:uncharacterized protein LOC111392732 [Olea europaea var. sylvestris]
MLIYFNKSIQLTEAIIEASKSSYVVMQVCYNYNPMYIFRCIVPDQENGSVVTGLEFPVGRITGFLSNRKFDERVDAGALVCLSAILEYLVIEVLELTGNEARDKKKNRIAPRHKQLAVKIDEDLSKLLGNVTIANSGVLTNINQCLSPKIADGKDKENGFASEDHLISPAMGGDYSTLHHNKAQALSYFHVQLIFGYIDGIVKPPLTEVDSPLKRGNSNHRRREADGFVTFGFGVEFVV